jgi:hypothetical protein
MSAQITASEAVKAGPAQAQAPEEASGVASSLDGDETITAVFPSDTTYAMNAGNITDGGEGNGPISVTGRAGAFQADGIMDGDGAVEEDAEDWDNLHIDRNDMTDILAGDGRENSDFETLLLDMTDNDELVLTDDWLHNLTHIDCDGTPNELIIDGGGTAKVKGVDTSGLVEAENVPLPMEGYTAFTYGEGEAASLVYIQNILLASGTDS